MHKSGIADRELARLMPDRQIARLLNRAGKPTGRGHGWNLRLCGFPLRLHDGPSGVVLRNCHTFGGCSGLLWAVRESE